MGVSEKTRGNSNEEEYLVTKRKEKNLIQTQLATVIRMNRLMIAHMKNSEYTPILDQLESFGAVLDFGLADLIETETMLLEKTTSKTPLVDRVYNIAVADIVYVGLFIAIFQYKNYFTTIDIISKQVNAYTR